MGNALSSVSVAGGPPAWSALPFVAYLLAVALAPLRFPRFWTSRRNQLALSLLAGLPVAAFLLLSHRGRLLASYLGEYVSFMVLLGALFVISGGIFLGGWIRGTPGANGAFLGLGALLASLIGTTGASMLLIRPLLRANQTRTRNRHLVVFFILIVANSGGLLTPLGDPPLFLGFLRGVPFLWTLRLLGPWVLANGAFLIAFVILDRAAFRREAAPPNPPPAGGPGLDLGSPRLLGAVNFVWLTGVIAVNFGARTLGLGDGLEKAALAAGTGLMAVLSLWTTPRAAREANCFTWGPIQETSILFLGVFLSMAPATLLVETWGRSGAMPFSHAWQFFWSSGAVSSVLDNAPTYLTFTSLACGVVGAAEGRAVDPAHLGQLLSSARGAHLLEAVSCGSVLMGAATYLGNGPNLLVKAVAEEHRVKMPGFLGYLGWSSAILIPVFAALTALFFRT